MTIAFYCEYYYISYKNHYSNYHTRFENANFMFCSSQIINQIQKICRYWRHLVFYVLILFIH